jgi:hypothetical protein
LLRPGASRLQREARWLSRLRLHAAATLLLLVPVLGREVGLRVLNLELGQGRPEVPEAKRGDVR